MHSRGFLASPTVTPTSSVPEKAYTAATIALHRPSNFPLAPSTLYSAKAPGSDQYRNPGRSPVGPPPTAIMKRRIMTPTIISTFREDSQNSNSPKALTLTLLMTRIKTRMIVMKTAGLTRSPTQNFMIRPKAESWFGVARRYLKKYEYPVAKPRAGSTKRVA